ncbi:hypothetical protein C0995_009146 [Termitomyces sp. Mi166|nr:hypothetical protein C0995_009146 [Termitomyces sp. Mi166\
MPLFVHLLRTFMLFLNIYDSYKTLRMPPPSSRNEGRPSQRALVQRKRDMKGCLAVWIVWVCMITYEGYLEGLVSLFTPFYNEFKSLGLLFLIMTRARGAEPIFLNFIRPLVKPYSPTIDLVLDLVRMFGDILFVILAIPTEYVHKWYKRFVSRSDNSLDSETKSSSITTTPLTRPAPSLNQESVCFPKEASSDRPASGNGNDQSSRSRTRIDRVGRRAQTIAHLDPHQIWYPPPSAYSDEEDAREVPGPDLQPPSSAGEMGELSSEASQEQKALDEWRQYPAFPSAYPPTPMVVSSAAFPSTSSTATRVQHITNSLMLTEIPEDAPRQGFSRSLLPPRRPLNPGFVQGLSDEVQTPGVRSDRLESMCVDSDSEDEDIFNTTLQTPPPIRTTQSGMTHTLPINREISVTSSVAARSIALTTNRNSLQTRSSSESLSSGDISMSDLPSFLGKKRPLPLDVLDVNTASQMVSGRSGTREALGDSARSQRFPINGTLRTEIEIIDEDTESTISTTGSINDRKTEHLKRRKVSQTPKRATLVSRPVRPRSRIARSATAPTKTTIPKPLKVPSSSRDAPGLSARSMTQHAGSSVARNASRTKLPSFIDEAAKQTAQPGTKNVVKGKSRQLASYPPSKAI